MNEGTWEAHAKINIALDVTGVRADGYHEVKMIMQELSLSDEVKVSKAGSGITLSVTGGGPDIPLDGRNIAVKAAKLLREAYGIREGIRIDLQKRIPSAAGLAGGSADAAAVLLAVNALFDLGLSEKALAEAAVKLGADVPFCLAGGTALSEGIGEKLTPVPEMPLLPVLLVKPGEGISTKEVYTAYDSLEGEIVHPDVEACIRDIREKKLQDLSAHAGNVLRYVTCERLPVIRELEEKLKAEGAFFAMMSGSGPTVFALFEKEEIRDRAFSEMKAAYPAFTVLSTST